MPPSPSALADDALKHLAPETLKPWPGNARTHAKKQVRQIADSIRTFGFTNPVLIDGVANHMRRSMPLRPPRPASIPQ